MERSEQEIKLACAEAKSKAEFARALGFKSSNGNTYKKLERLIESLALDTSHFTGTNYSHIRYEKIERPCPVCGKTFVTRKGHAREKKTCSYACSNTHFRSGQNNPNWRESSYRSTCFLHHKKKCVVCGEDKIVDVHHFDEDKENNSPENLVPLCPTHHMYCHSRYKGLVIKKIERYLEHFGE